MFATIKGKIVSVQFNEPTRKDSFQPHQLISVLQINEKGDAEIVKIKDENLQRKWDITKDFLQLCSINYWSLGSRSGLNLKVV